MPRPDPHPVLSRQGADALRLLSDPECDCASVLPSVEARDADVLVRAASVHGTISTAFRHLRERGVSGQLETAFRKSETRVLSAISGAMRLRRWSDRMTAAFEDESVAHTLIKGPVFATRLYRHTSDRTLHRHRHCRGGQFDATRRHGSDRTRFRSRRHPRSQRRRPLRVQMDTAERYGDHCGAPHQPHPFRAASTAHVRGSRHGSRGRER